MIVVETIKRAPPPRPWTADAWHLLNGLWRPVYENVNGILVHFSEVPAPPPLFPEVCSWEFWLDAPVTCTCEFYFYYGLPGPITDCHVRTSFCFVPVLVE